jgi:hypothetical protein
VFDKRRLRNLILCEILTMGESTKPRLSLYRIGLWLAILAFAGLTGWRLASATRDARQTDEGLYVSPQHLNIGEVWENPAFKCEVPIENHTTKDIRIDGFMPSCTCLSIEPASVVVPAKGSATVTLTLSLMLGSPKLADLDNKAVDGSFTARVSGGLPQEAGWTLTGNVRRVLRLKPRQIYFGPGLVKGQPFEAQSVVAHTTEPLRELTARCDLSQGSAKVSRIAGHEGEFTVAVRPSAALPAGPFHFDVTLEATSETKGKLPSVTLPVEGHILEDIQAVPEFLLFGSQPVGTTMTQTVLLRSASLKRFTVGAVTSLSDGLTIEPSDEGAIGSSKAFRVSQRIAKAGKQEANIVIPIRAADGTSSTVTVKVTYIGLPSK